MADGTSPTVSPRGRTHTDDHVHHLDKMTSKTPLSPAVDVPFSSSPYRDAYLMGLSRDSPGVSSTRPQSALRPQSA